MNDARTPPTLEETKRTLQWHAAIFLFIGMLSALVIMVAPVGVVARAAHVVAMLQSAVLFGVASAWPSLNAGPKVLAAIKYLALVGLYCNYGGTQLASLTKAKKVFFVTAPLIPEGVHPVMESIVTVLLSSSIILIPAFGLFLWAMRPGAVKSRAS
jgi:hypothetical protein